MTPNSNPSLARRAFPALALIGAAGTLVYALDRPSSSASASSLDELSTSDVGDDGAAVAVDSIIPPAVGDDDDGSDDAGTDDADTTAGTTKKTTTTDAPATTVAKSGSSSTCSTFKGPTVSTRFGPVQVKASVAPNGKICSVTVLQTPTGGKSGRINDRAVPILDSRTMSAQSAKINAVSGATVTSKAYKKSLQAILDAAT